MIHLEDVRNQNHPRRMNAVTDDFWSLTESQKQKSTVRTTHSPILDLVVKDKDGDWAIRNHDHNSEKYYDTKIKKGKSTY